MKTINVALCENILSKQNVDFNKACVSAVKHSIDKILKSSKIWGDDLSDLSSATVSWISTFTI